MAFEIVKLPRIDVTIVAVTAGDASLEIVSPVENVPEVVRAPEL